MNLRDLDPDDLDAAYDVRTRAFGPASADDRGRWLARARDAVADGRYLGIFDGSRLVGAALIYDMAQWWLGRDVPMAGVASVTVSPEDRGRGVGRLLMAAVLDRISVRGYPISVLYPATTPLYRGFGWEHAGAQYWATLPAEAVRAVARPGDGSVALRRVGPGDAADVVATLRRLHAVNRDCGPIDRGELLWRLALGDEHLYAYLAEDGFLAYRWHGSETALLVERVVAGSEPTLRTLWGLVGSGSSVADTVHACVAANDPVLWLTRESVAAPARRKVWMLRLVDVVAAVAARGFPAAVTAEVALHLDDPALARNTGTWRLRVRGGTGELARSDDDPDAPRFGPRGLAALYAGTPMAALRRTGLVTGGDPRVDPVLDAVFAATPFLLDYF